MPYNVKTIVYNVTFCSRPEFVKRGLELNIGFLFQELLYFMSLFFMLMFHNSVALNIYVEFYLIWSIYTIPRQSPAMGPETIVIYVK